MKEDAIKFTLLHQTKSLVQYVISLEIGRGILYWNFMNLVLGCILKIKKHIDLACAIFLT